MIGPETPFSGQSLPAQTVVVWGMPGWQIALIAVAAAVTAAFLDRARATRRHQATPGT